MFKTLDITFEGIALDFIRKRYDAFFLVDADSGRCMRLWRGALGEVRDERSYQETIDALSANMSEHERAAFALKLELGSVLSALEEHPFYSVYYRPDAGRERLRRLMAWRHDRAKRILLVALSEEGERVWPFSRNLFELPQYRERFHFLLKNLCEFYLELDVETGDCLKIDTDNFEETRKPFSEHIRLIAEKNIVPSQAEAFLQEFERDNILGLLHRNNGLFTCRYTADYGSGKRELLIVAVLMHDLFFEAREQVFFYAQDITDLKLQEERNRRLADMSRADPLTGLLNRAACEKLIVRHLGNSGSAGGTLLMIDVDNFKEFNDAYGHPAGDSVLKYLSKWMRAVFRQDDYICRWGGDEFMVFVRNAVQLPGVRTRIAMLCEKADKFCLDGIRRPIQLSIGGSVAEPGDSFEVLFAQADRALYSVKRNGRNGWAFFDRNRAMQAQSICFFERHGQNSV